MARRIAKRQPPVKGGRNPLPACVLHDISHAVDHTAVRFGVSRSWVISTILAEYFGITEQVNYDTTRRKGERAPLRIAK